MDQSLECQKVTGDVKGFDVVPNTAELRQILKEIFSDEFMKAHTNFDSFDIFKFSSAVICNWEKDPLIYSRYLLDHFVRESTEFDSWDRMIRVAADEKYHSQK